MRLLSALILVAFWCIPTFALAEEQEPIRKVVFPMEVREEIASEVSIPPEIQGKVWNRWTSDNFTVLSLNDIQAQYLHKHLELVKVWLFTRWGMYDIPFNSECKMICVDDPELYYKMFKIREPLVEIRRDENGKIQETVIFVLINDAPSHTVPVPLTEVCMAEFSQLYNQDFPWFLVRGMSLLNGALDQIRANFHEFTPYVKGNKPVYFSKGMFEMSKDEYLALDAEKRRIFDYSAMTLALLVRKEFGENKFHWFIKTCCEQGGEAALKEVLNFQSTDDFDKTLRRYMIDITRDIESGKTPDDYLQIQKVEN